MPAPIAKKAKFLWPQDMVFNLLHALFETLNNGDIIRGRNGNSVLYNRLKDI